MTFPPDDPGPPPPPVWSHFLTPLAILLGAAAIVVAIVVTDDGSESSPPVAPALDSLSDSAESLSASAQSLADAADSLSEAADRSGSAAQGGAPAREGTEQEPTTLRDALDAYAESLGLDVASFGQCFQSAAAEEAVVEQLQRGVALGVNGTPTFFINDKFISGAQPAWVFAEVIAAELAGSPSSIEEYSEELQVLARRDPPGFAIVAQRPDVAGVAIEGSPAARVMIVEFSDFQCPFCRRWYDDTLPQLRDLIGDDVALAFLHFPLTQIHPNAPAAHVAAHCAGEQGKFWEMHDLLFEQQDVWSRLPNLN
ncbi:MAG: thioredoxin domain-containing protein [Dehalococcoidia bacterium]|nr:thioredoxin domain-containing protein [Dehalococcoidia bacterium]